ncbi:hypothetical protein [Leptospira noguchii]|uniref:hypothetical protein n=1 Tax=Leptospira noguchii TaxID=28182 RepID=UPI00032844A5|nr:hypothetical protein [Leptospira noguchii]EMS81909.1 hypothetical protein LEP1GSC074_0029 [Leptospira noguchii str. Hook]
MNHISFLFLSLRTKEETNGLDLYNQYQTTFQSASFANKGRNYLGGLFLTRQITVSIRFLCEQRKKQRLKSPAKMYKKKVNNIF